MSRTLKQTRERQNTPAPEREKSFEEKVADKAGEMLVQAAANEQAVAARLEMQRQREEQARQRQVAASLPHSNPAEKHVQADQEAEARRAVDTAYEIRNGAALLTEIDKKRAATLQLGHRVAEELRAHDKNPTHCVVIPVATTKERRFRKDIVETHDKKVHAGWYIPFVGPRHPGGHLMLLENGDILGLRGYEKGALGDLSVLRTQEGGYNELTPEFESDITRPIYTPPAPNNGEDWQTIENRGIVIAQHEAGIQEGLFNLYMAHFPDASPEEVRFLGRPEAPASTPLTTGRHRAPE